MTRTDVTTTQLDAMGTTAEIVVVGGPRTRGGSDGAARRAAVLLDDLEQRWSRFRPDSDITRLNRAEGATVRVHWTTRDLLLLAIECWRRTGGRFDPTVGAAVVANGYDRSFRTLPATVPVGDARPQPAPGCAGIRIDVDACTVTMPAEVRLDLGGIGKGYAADLLVAELLDAGAEGACVNVGGDVRVSGTAPHGCWVIELDDPGDRGRPLGSVRLQEGAVAMSAAMARSWRTTTGTAHHLVDPHAGTPARNGLAGAAVLAGAGWWAEALTKVLLTAPAHRALDIADAVGAGAHALVVADDGEITHHDSLTAFLTGPLGAPAAPAPTPTTAPTTAATPPTRIGAPA